MTPEQITKLACEAGFDGFDALEMKVQTFAKLVRQHTLEEEAALKPGVEPAFWLDEQGQLSVTKGWAERNSPGQQLIPLYTAAPRLTDEEVGMLTVYGGLHHVEVPLLANYIRHIERYISSVRVQDCRG
jgi:hypothetical protein